MTFEYSNPVYSLLHYSKYIKKCCELCGENLSGDVYLLHNTNSQYHTRCVINYWEGLDKSKLKYINIREKFVWIYIRIYQSLQEKSLEKYGTPLAKLDTHSIQEFIVENMETVQELEFYLKEIMYQESKNKCFNC